MTEERMPRRPAIFDQAFLIGVEDVTELLLIRHAQQHVDTDAATVGDWIDPPLSEHGRHQAKLLGAALSTTKLDAVFASPLKRAAETAQAVAHHHELEVEFFDDLREIELFRDVPPEKTATDFFGSDLLNAVRQRMLNERRWDVYPYSESSYDFRKRTINAMEAIIARNAGERVAIVCHGGVINAYASHIIGSPYDMFFRPAHTSLNVVAAGDGRRVLRLLNDVHHLRTEAGDFHTY
jgi:broad specificity phosphatase PhoE